MTEIPEDQILQCGKRFFESVKAEKPSVFDKSQWIGKVMDWAMKDDAFKVQLFRFVDVFPYLNTGNSLSKHLQEYFGDQEGAPTLLKWSAKGSRFGGALGNKILTLAIRYNIKSMAKQFIIGENSKAAIKNLLKLRKEGFTFVVDLLGEATVNEEEAETHFHRYLKLLDAIGKSQRKWQPVSTPDTPNTPSKDWGYAPMIQISVKVTALYSQIKPVDFENSVSKILQRIEPIYDKIIELGGALCLDMESYTYKSIIIEVFRRLRSHERFRHYPHLGIVLQAYLRDTEADLEQLIDWSKTQNLPIEIRLVKGAYWDYEVIQAEQHGWPPRVWNHKAETDAAFEQHALKILQNHAICYFACGSHNIRSISAVMETAKALNVPQNRYEFQVLYGMATPIRKGLHNIASRVRLYAPYGEIIPGMAYLVRRLLENTANESFLRLSFAEEADIKTLLQNPKQLISNCGEKHCLST